MLSSAQRMRANRLSITNYLRQSRLVRPKRIGAFRGCDVLLKRGNDFHELPTADRTRMEPKLIAPDARSRNGEGCFQSKPY